MKCKNGKQPLSSVEAKTNDREVVSLNSLLRAIFNVSFTLLLLLYKKIKWEGGLCGWSVRNLQFRFGSLTDQKITVQKFLSSILLLQASVRTFATFAGRGSVSPAI